MESRDIVSGCNRGKKFQDKWSGSFHRLETKKIFGDESWSG